VLRDPALERIARRTHAERHLHVGRFSQAAEYELIRVVIAVGEARRRLESRDLPFDTAEIRGIFHRRVAVRRPARNVSTTLRHC
jgi:hypothetical protein